MQVSPSLIKRSKTHFHNFGGVGVIMSNNGMIWIHPAEEKGEDGEKLKSNEPVVVGTEVRLTDVHY